MPGCKIFPDPLPQKIRNDPKRRAECNVYDNLKAQLDDPTFHVFYSKDWLNTKLKKLYREDGECDFIIAHPDLGLLFIEVKGGIVRKDGKTDTWYSGEYKIKNPILQARDSKHVIRESMREIWGASMPFIKMVHCALLPDSACSKTYLGEGYPIEIFGFMDDMPELAKKIYEYFDFETANDSRITGRLGGKGVEILCRMFSKDINFSPRLFQKLAHHSYLIEERTNAQKSIVHSIRKMDKVVIEGPAGSGKTMLAIDMALRELDSLSIPDNNILLTCFNAPLALFLKSLNKSADDRLWINSFHSLCMKLALKSGVLTEEEINKNISAFYKNAAKYGWEAAERLGPLFNTIIIDEAQDFEQDWWELLQFLLKEKPTSRVRVFRDNNQRIRHINNPKFLQLQGPLELDTIVRNTKQIGLSTITYYSGDSVLVDGPEGESVLWYSTDNEFRQVEKLIKRFTTYEGVPVADIAILTGNDVKNTVFRAATHIADHPLVKCDDISTGLVLDSIQRYKGLERDVVILCGFSDPPSDELLYVGMSRAKSLLALVAKQAYIEEIKNNVEAAYASLTCNSIH